MPAQAIGGGRPIQESPPDPKTPLEARPSPAGHARGPPHRPASPLNDRILFVEPRSDLHAATTRSLEGLGTVELVRSGPGALELLEREGAGAYAVLVCEYASGSAGRELLRAVRGLDPGLVTVVLSKVVDVDAVIQALHAGRIFRFLERPCPQGRVREAVEAALEEQRAHSDQTRRATRADFSSKVLGDFNQLLEGRLEEQHEALVGIHRFVADLNLCDSLADIARTTGIATSGVCPGRGVFVELWDGSPQGERSHFVTGPALADLRHTQPIASTEGAVGSLVVASHDGNGQPLSRTARGMLESLAASCAVAAHNQHRRRERNQAQQAAILALAKLALQRDNETGKHLERVSRFCRIVAEGLVADGFYTETITPDWVADLVRSSPLHDIGKVGIPDRILLKPGKLDAREWDIMRTHAELGARTLEEIIVHQENEQTFLEMSMRIAWCHHEKWDGTGYPRNLSGEQIPLEARILAIADVYDALTSRRPYKEPWLHAEAVRWIAEAAGTHFDPRCVRVFVRRHREFDAVRQRLADTDEDLARLSLRAA